MKNSIVKLICLLPILAMISFSSCTEEEVSVYDATTLDDILLRSTSLSEINIEGSNADGYTLKIADVIIYKTGENRYGKFEIVNFDDDENKKLTINAVTYNNDGSIFKQTENLEIRGTWLCDLDAMVEAGTSGDNDFQWKRLTSTDSEIEPRGSAIFAIY